MFRAPEKVEKRETVVLKRLVYKIYYLHYFIWEFQLLLLVCRLLMTWDNVCKFQIHCFSDMIYICRKLNLKTESFPRLQVYVIISHYIGQQLIAEVPSQPYAYWNSQCFPRHTVFNLMFACIVRKFSLTLKFSVLAKSLLRYRMFKGRWSNKNL